MTKHLSMRCKLLIQKSLQSAFHHQKKKHPKKTPPKKHQTRLQFFLLQPLSSNFLFNLCHLIGEEIDYACVFLKLVICCLFYFQVQLVHIAASTHGCLSYHTRNIGQGYIETIN